jgi:serine/threonine-protein kinase HipA
MGSAMRKLEVLLHCKPVGVLYEISKKEFSFDYASGYTGPSISLTMPTTNRSYNFNKFPSFFDGLLPEGAQLNYLLKSKKIDEDDYFSQLIAIGDDFVGAVSVKEIKE